jgi:hypothetical protein
MRPRIRAERRFRAADGTILPLLAFALIILLWATISAANLDWRSALEALP